MKPAILATTLISALLLLAGCDERAHQVDSGGVILSASIEGEFPYRVSVNASDRFLLENIQLQSILANPNAGSSDLMTVEVNLMEVTFSRADGGTILPPPLVRTILAVVPPGGTTDLSLTVMTSEQMRNPPLSDLLFENGGFDRETGKTNIKLNLHLRFFGETLGGRSVQTEPRSLTIEFVQ